MPPKTCAHPDCDNLFEPRPRKRYCSDACQANRFTFVCRYCGKGRWGHKEQQYCDRDCMGKAISKATKGVSIVQKQTTNPQWLELGRYRTWREYRRAQGIRYSWERGVTHGK